MSRQTTLRTNDRSGSSFVLRLAEFWARGGALLGALGLSVPGQVAVAQCFNNPIDQTLAGEMDPYPGPFNAVLCLDPPTPYPCLVPATPTLESVPIGNSSATQEITLRAVRPTDSGTAFTSVVWSASYFDPDSGWTPLWNNLESKDSLANIQQVNGQYVASFGATGLKPGFRHQFAVAWCREYSNQRGCTCWSAPGDTVNSIPATFPTLNPAPPVNTTQRMEDNFARPYSTTAKRDPDSGNVLLGDGLGPDSAWQDLYFIYGALGNGSKIIKPASGTSYAVMPQAALANYKAIVATHQHSYAEARWSLETTTARDSWNFDVHARCHLGQGGLPRAYAAKFHRSQYGAGSKPRLSVMRIVDGTPIQLGFVEFTSDSTCQTGTTTDCSCMPNLVGSPSQAVWLRVEVEDTGSPVRPDVRATVAWDDSNLPSCGPSISACPHKCTFTKRDNSTIGSNFVGEKGEWGLDAHEGDYHISPFRAGNE